MSIFWGQQSPSKTKKKAQLKADSHGSSNGPETHNAVLMSLKSPRSKRWRLNFQQKYWTLKAKVSKSVSMQNEV